MSDDARARQEMLRKLHSGQATKIPTPRPADEPHREPLPTSAPIPTLDTLPAPASTP